MSNEFERNDAEAQLPTPESLGREKDRIVEMMRSGIPETEISEAMGIWQHEKGLMADRESDEKKDGVPRRVGVLIATAELCFSAGRIILAKDAIKAAVQLFEQEKGRLEEAGLLQDMEANQEFDDLAYDVMWWHDKIMQEADEAPEDAV